MSPRYLIVLPRAAGAPLPAADELAARLGFRTVSTGAGMLAFVNDDCPALPLVSGALVLGTIFPRHGPHHPIREGDREEVSRLAAATADMLGRYWWGAYVAVLPDSRGLAALRDPSGGLPCWMVVARGCVLLGSDMACLLATRLIKPKIDWSALGRHFYRSGLPTSETVLAGISELLPGTVLSGAGSQRQFWLPWDHARPGDEPAQQAERLAGVVTSCVRAVAAPHRHLLVSLSGGLDSSIVCAALGRSGRATCLTLYGDDASADERDYARLVCAHLGMPLVERRYRLEDVDLSRAPAPLLPRPIGRIHALAYEQAHLEVARAEGADAFMTGNGGDNVFGFSQSAASAADRFRREGLGPGLRALGDVMRQTGCGPLAALRAAVRILRKPAGYRWRPDPVLLHPDIVSANAAAGLDHPWLEVSDGALPGKAAHIAALLRVQQLLEPGRSSLAPVLNPLLSQPVVEACLAIPSWQWRLGGEDRAIARLAFAPYLPAAIVRRRAKGGPDSFAGAVLAHFRQDIRERLLDGQLARHGLVDTLELDALLAGEDPVPGACRARLLHFLAAEAWLDHWCATLDQGGGVAPGGRFSRSHAARSACRSGASDRMPRSQ